jgi:hypothetical protein
VHLMVGTGYGLEPDWRHGMYQGPDPVVQGVGYDLSRPEDAARMWGWSTRSAGSATTGTRGTACTSTGRSVTTRRSGSRGRSSPRSPDHALEDTAAFNIRQLTDVLRCNLQQHFRRKRHRVSR